MKATLRLVCAALAVASPLTAQTDAAKPAGEKEAANPAGEAAAPAPSASMDKVSYFIGTQIGANIANNFKQQGIDLDLDNFLDGMRNQFEGKEPKFKQEELEEAMKGFEAVMQGKMAKQREEQMAAAEATKAAGTKFLDENKSKPNIKTTDSGLQYEVISEGKGEKPKVTDQVSVHYTGTLLNGKVFDSSVQRGEPATFGLQQVIKGWTEGLQLMTVGSKYKFYIPSDLAYGDNGAGEDIGPGETLVFEVELLDIVK